MYITVALWKIWTG